MTRESTWTNIGILVYLNDGRTKSLSIPMTSVELRKGDALESTHPQTDLPLFSQSGGIWIHCGRVSHDIDQCLDGNRNLLKALTWPITDISWLPQATQNRSL